MSYKYKNLKMELLEFAYTKMQLDERMFNQIDFINSKKLFCGEQKKDVAMRTLVHRKKTELIEDGLLNQKGTKLHITTKGIKFVVNEKTRKQKNTKLLTRESTLEKIKDEMIKFAKKNESFTQTEFVKSEFHYADENEFMLTKARVRYAKEQLLKEGVLIQNRFKLSLIKNDCIEENKYNNEEFKDEDYDEVVLTETQENIKFINDFVKEIFEKLTNDFLPHIILIFIILLIITLIATFA